MNILRIMQAFLLLVQEKEHIGYFDNFHHHTLLKIQNNSRFPTFLYQDLIPYTDSFPKPPALSPRDYLEEDGHDIPNKTILKQIGKALTENWIQIEIIEQIEAYKPAMNKAKELAAKGIEK